ncbi:MAG TPA: wax ester/triacylglycerol synthase family O-acyltransferase [Rubrivivax sp.]|nr:wax ester/triacylglycerol synthase family O-acyltransferase [Rubrivivax sp.]
MVKMSLQDASMLRVESPTTPMHIGFLLTFKLPPKAPRDFLQRLHEKMQRFAADSPPFNYRVAPAKSRTELPQWEVVDHVDLEYHLRHEALPAPGTERELGLVMSRLHSVPLDPSRPMWEFYFIEGLQGGRFGVYLKIHHSMADGMLLMERLPRTMANSPTGKSLPPWAVPPASGDDQPPIDDAGDAWRKWLQGLFKASRDKDKKKSGIPKGPRSLLNGSISGRRRFATQTMDLNRVKALAKAAEATVNDVVMALCSGALRRFLDEFDSIPSESLVASIPVALPRGKGEMLSGNSVGGINTEIASHIADPRQRLEAIKQSMRDAKVELQQTPPAVSRTINAVGMYVMSLIPPGGSDRAPLTNLTISNVPGPKTAMYLDGAEMDGMYPASVLTGDHRVNITLVGYRDRLCFGIIGCPDKLPHVQRLSVLLPEALDELEAAYGLAKSKPGKSGRAAKPAKTGRPAKTSTAGTRAAARATG